MKKRISLILKEASELKTVNERIAHLHKYDSLPLQGVLKVMFDNDIQLSLPAGSPPYTPNVKLEAELDERLYADWKKLYIFFEASSPNIKKVKREQLFIEFLEGLHPEDAELIIAMKDGKSPYQYLTPSVARKAYPALFPNFLETTT